MITEYEYNKAKNIVLKYEQEQKQKTEKLAIYKPGVKLKILRANGNSLIKTGDIIEIINSYYTDFIVIEFRNKNGVITKINDKGGWSWIVI